jgi:hypothetical protein
VRLSVLRPFLSLLLLQIQDADAPERVFRQLTERAMRRRVNNGTDVELLAEGLEESALSSGGVTFDQGAAAIWRRRRTASWAVDGSPYVDVDHELMLCLRRGQLVAVLGPDSVRRAVVSWIDKKPPRPPVRRVSPGVINAALLAGAEAKTMWMKSVRGRSASRPDAKTLSGMDLISALDPIGDGSFTLGAARVALPQDDERHAFTGTVGATPHKSRVWSRGTDGAAEFLLAVSEALVMLQETLDSGVEVLTPYETLSSQVDTLEGVRGAFEFRCPLPSDLPSDASLEEVDAAHQLTDVTVNAQPMANSSDVILDVGFGNRLAGQLRVAVSLEGGRVRTALGHHGQGTDPPAVAEIRNLLDQLDGHSIHYMSGHAVMNGGVFQVRQTVAPFTGWDFRDFTGYRITREKPDRRGGTDQDVRDHIGEPGDESLFGWVARSFTTGTLLCDDGAGELADFLHVDDDGTLSLIHVKAADSASEQRQIAVAKYEVVVSQAVKNLAHLNTEQLAARLQTSSITEPAAWNQGQRVTGRQDFLDSLSLREPADLLKVVVVQPHVMGSRLRRLRAMDPATHHEDLHRLRLLDTLLNAARVACIGSNGDISVIGAC